MLGINGCGERIEDREAGRLDHAELLVKGDRLVHEPDEVVDRVGELLGAQVGFAIGAVVLAKTAIGCALQQTEQTDLHLQA